MMTGLISISWVRNEADIIEAWVRHNAQFIDRMIIVLHCCDDNTKEILELLRDEGLPLDIHESEAPAHEQEQVLTNQLHQLATEPSAWVLPIDADEFLVTTDGASLHELLDALPQDRVTLLPWKTYIPTVNDSITDSNILQRTQHRRSTESPQYYKVLIPPRIASQSHNEITPGSHNLYNHDTKTPYPSESTTTITLAHFPVRSADQLRTKVFGGWLSLSAHAHKKSGVGFHWQVLFEQLRDGKDISREQLEHLALTYATPSREEAPSSTLVHDRIQTDAATIRYEQRCCNPWKLLAQTAEIFAQRCARSVENSPTAGYGIRALAETLAKQTDALSIGNRELSEMLTMTLFAARLRSGPSFSWQDTQALLSVIPLEYCALREVLSQEDPPHQSAIDSIVTTLQEADMEKLQQECDAINNNDIFSHFYEAFLALFNTNARNWRCAFYTPRAIAQYAARSLDVLLRETLNIEEGLSDKNTYTLDVAAGTGVALLHALECALEKDAKNVHIHNFSSLELMQAPRLITHLRAGTLLEQYGHASEESLQLECKVGDAFAQESILPSNMPKEAVLALLSNPPYNQFSPWEFLPESTVATCYQEYLDPIVETGLDVQPLRADYVKFTALAHDALRQVSQGVAVLTIRNAFLRSHAHLGMRKVMLDDFDQIYVLNLRGDPSDRLQDPKRTDDENVYRTMVGHDLGICMLFFVKGNTAQLGVFYNDLFGSREEKYRFLSSHTIANTKWQMLTPESPYYLFAPTQCQENAPIHATNVACSLAEMTS